MYTYTWPLCPSSGDNQALEPAPVIVGLKFISHCKKKKKSTCEIMYHFTNEVDEFMNCSLRTPMLTGP